MTTHTRTTILKTAKQLFAKNGYEGFSMRTLASESGAGLSSIYNYFADKDELLKELFDQTNRQLGEERAKLKVQNTASLMLEQRIRFQFENIESVVFVLKYYLHFRPEFIKILDTGYLPTKAYLHIEEVLRKGIETREFVVEEAELHSESKVIAHAINGFLLEYYPNPPKGTELTKLIASIHKFLLKSLTNKEALMI